MRNIIVAFLSVLTLTAEVSASSFVNHDEHGSLLVRQDSTISDSGTEVIPDSLCQEADSTRHTTALEGVTVVADTRYMTADGKSVYIPTSREKKISRDGTSLLRNMAIASVHVSPENGALSTPSGEGIATFIDYLPASPQMS